MHTQYVPKPNENALSRRRHCRSVHFHHTLPTVPKSAEIYKLDSVIVGVEVDELQVVQSLAGTEIRVRTHADFGRGDFEVHGIEF
jgi:hypothetical protein